MLQALDVSGSSQATVSDASWRCKNNSTALPLKTLVVGEESSDLDALCQGLAGLRSLSVSVTRAPTSGAVVDALLHSRFDAVIMHVTGDAPVYTDNMSEPEGECCGPLRILLVDPDAAKPSAQMIAADAVCYVNRNGFSGPLLEKTILDAIESRRMERDLRESAVAFERAEQHRGEQLSRVAHALRLPLLDILKRSDALAARTRELATCEHELADARSIFESSLQALDLINDLVNEAAEMTMEDAVAGEGTAAV